MYGHLTSHALKGSLHFLMRQGLVPLHYRYISYLLSGWRDPKCFKVKDLTSLNNLILTCFLMVIISIMFCKLSFAMQLDFLHFLKGLIKLQILLDLAHFNQLRDKRIKISLD